MACKYVKQWDLPCYPNEKPEPNNRSICGIEDRGSDVKPEHRFQIWMGGGGLGACASIEEAQRELQKHVFAQLQIYLSDAERQVEYYNKLLEQIEVLDLDPFRVIPDSR